jgi:UDP-2-acetamido-3-amino-2,3-dideoxy-glucuronate N-acetyltransferase
MHEESRYFAHASAILDEGSVIGDGARIWHFCHVMSGARIGARSMLGQGVFVASGVIVGQGAKIQNNVSLYDGVELGDDVFVGPSAVFTNVKNPRAHVSRRSEYARTLVHRGATIGANATIMCGVTIGEYAFIAAGAVVTSDVPSHALFMGVPARQRGFACRCGESLRRLGVACSACGETIERREETR